MSTTVTAKPTHWNENVVILTKFSSLAALEVVKMTTSSAASDENVIKMKTFLFQWHEWVRKGMPDSGTHRDTKTHIHMHSLFEFLYMTYIYIQQECHSVLVKLHPITFYRTVFLGSARSLGWMPLVVFFGLPIVSCSMINGLILRSLWSLVFVLNILILGIWCSTISHLPEMFLSLDLLSECRI